ncbi:unnamed protein product [Adineta steineri]|uniref:Uncharacterized protein n=1 Tax=Adineta steineri TaxID=433720 RepID=A0A813Z3K9_9BILA|nr:unnamed protein product [Adineta steineri]
MATLVLSTTTQASRYNCSCQCPRGSSSGYAYSTVNSVEGCVDACKAVSSNPCLSSNTYACLGTNCTYSDLYISTTTQASRYNCSCQCPRGSSSGYAYTTEYSASSCVSACKAVSSNPCLSTNTYACLGTDCAYSDSYISTTTQASRYNCSCQCPRGSDSGYAYSTINSLAGCVDACKAVSSNICISSNTFVCLGTKCAYSGHYNHTCSCQCPRGSSSGYAYTTEYSASSCVSACKAVSSNPCLSTNTYACLGTDCAYSDSYISTTTQASRYNCSCQCPRGSDSGYAYSTVNSAKGCVDACRAVVSNPCFSSNTYACLGMDCAYAESYNFTTIAITEYNQSLLGT